MIDSSFWRAPQASSPVRANLTLPGSKSITNRLLVIAALADGPSLIQRPLRARDTELMVNALTALGHQAEWRKNEELNVVPGDMSRDAAIDCGLAGNVMRFVPAISGLSTGTITFDGDLHARKRPLIPLLEALRQAGVVVDNAMAERANESLPFRVVGTGRIRGGPVSIDSSASSQFVTALLLAGCRFDEGLALHTVGASVPSRPHVNMTVRLLDAAGVQVDAPDDNTWVVGPGVPKASSTVVEPDLSNAFAFFAAAMMTGGTCQIAGFPRDSIQPTSKVLEIVTAFGGTLEQGDESLTVRAPDDLRGVELDLNDVGELVPNVAAIAAVASTPSRLRGVAHLRGHETDRLAALSTELSSVGCTVRETDDGLVITPGQLHGGQMRTYDDHRMATTAALIGLVTAGIDVENVGTTAKTLPEFTRLWNNMLGM